MIRAGKIICPDEVHVELKRQEDGLAKWAKQQDQLLVPLDEEIQKAATVLLRSNPLLMKATKNRNGADPWVIATAKVRGLTVVTEENGGTARKPKIPSVCAATNVPCVDVLTFIRQAGWKFN